MNDDRLIDLELRYMHQEQTIADLSDVVYRQSLIIEQLQRDISQMREQIQLTSPSLNRSPDEEEPPPHY